MKGKEINQVYRQELLEAIPVVEPMGVEVEEVKDDSVAISAPLKSNINYEGTAFGGSLNTLSILASFLMVHHIVKMARLPLSSLVIQDSQIKYLKPVKGQFFAKATVLEKPRQTFLRSLKARQRGRISIQCEISTADQKSLVQFEGRFVAEINPSLGEE